MVFPLSTFLMFTFVFARSLVRASRSFADRLSSVSQNDVVAISYFVRSKQFSSATEGCGGGCLLHLTWNGCSLLLRSAKRNFKRMFLVKLLKSLIRLLSEYGFVVIGMNFKPFESKLLS